MKLTTLGTVIAERTLDLSPSGRVVVSVGKPRKTPGYNDYVCPFEIRGLNKHWRSYIVGLDRVQALDLTMKHIGALLYMSEEGKANKLSWLGERDIGFPVPDSMKDLIPSSRRTVKKSATRSSSRKKSSRD